MTDTSTPHTLVIAGGSGFLGGAFVRHLLAQSDQARQIVILSRSEPDFVRDSPNIRHARWDGRSLGDWVDDLDGCTHVLNLAGRSVDCRKTADRCDEILRSRVESTRVFSRIGMQISMARKNLRTLRST